MGKRITFERIKYLKLLAETYPTINSASTEIINLQAILNLPKGTEHFLSDIHGEFLAFNHVLLNGSGVIKDYIEEIFGNTLRQEEKRDLAMLVYYPEQKISAVMRSEKNMDDWYKITLFRLVHICKRVSSKYTRSKVRKALTKDFSYIIEELIHEDSNKINKAEYYQEIINYIIRLNRAPAFITAVSQVIHRLAIDRLHIIGDIYDRGPEPEKIMNLLMKYHSVDIQWGNHDINWLGAAAGCETLICNVIRICAKYNNLHILEEGYGINLVPLATFAFEWYRNDDCCCFVPDSHNNKSQSFNESGLIAMMHKAITILQFKMEAQIINRQTLYDMDERILLDKIDYNKGTITINGVEHYLKSKGFPTINKDNPLELSKDEKELIKKLKLSFTNCQKLQDHAKVLFNKGSMYLAFNCNLLFHGCIPFNSDGTFKEVKICGGTYSGKDLLDKIEEIVRKGYFHKDESPKKNDSCDMMWYLWCGPDSPLFGKDKMTTFERYFIEKQELWYEEKDPYYELRNSEKICKMILENFGLNPEKGHIINGHVPVKVKKGESPIKAGGKLFVIDGGFAKAYQNVTGIAGYTLIYNSRGLVLAEHEPMDSFDECTMLVKDMVTQTKTVEFNRFRTKVGDTDIGKDIKNKINDLEDLLLCFQKGLVKENL